MPGCCKSVSLVRGTREGDFARALHADGEAGDPPFIVACEPHDGVVALKCVAVDRFQRLHEIGTILNAPDQAVGPGADDIDRADLVACIMRRKFREVDRRRCCLLYTSRCV